MICWGYLSNTNPSIRYQKPVIVHGQDKWNDSKNNIGYCWDTGMQLIGWGHCSYYWTHQKSGKGLRRSKLKANLKASFFCSTFNSTSKLHKLQRNGKESYCCLPQGILGKRGWKKRTRESATRLYFLVIAEMLHSWFFQHHDHLNKNLIIISIDTVMKIRGSLGTLPTDKELKASNDWRDRKNWLLQG